MEITPIKQAARVAAIYLALGALWLIGGYVYLIWYAPGADRSTVLQISQDAIFALFTGAIFFFLAKKELARQQRTNEEALRRKRALQSLFEASFNHAAVGMAYTLPEGRFLRVNRAFCELVGYSIEELLTIKYQDITHPDDLEADLAQQRRMLAGEIDSFTMDKRYIRKDGAVVWTTLTSSVAPDLQGEGNHYLAVVNDISARKSAEDALRASEARFRALVEQSITGVYVFDHEAFRYVNRRLAVMFGYSEDELTDRLGPFDLIAPEDQATVRAQVERRLNGKIKSAHYTVRGLRKDGSRIWVELYGSRMELDGRPAITGTALDITERVEVERHLIESEARFRAIYDGVNDAILIIDPGSGAIMDVNRRAEELGGYSVDEARKLNIIDLSVADRDEAQADATRRIEAAMGGEPQIFEWRVRSRDGRPFWVEINMRAARIDGTKRILVLARDITERRASEEKLRLTSQVFTSTREGVIITDTENRILSVNPAFMEITGYSEEEVIGKTPNILQSGFHDHAYYQAMWQSIVKTNHWQGEIWNRRKSGEAYPEWLTISAVRNAHGAVTNYVGVFADVSRLKHSEAEVQRLAHYDPLTNFPNRSLLMSRLEHALELCRRKGTRIPVMFCGLDRTRNINDSLGYSAGDELLQAISRRIRSKLQSGDTVARFGGDEFVVLLEVNWETEEIAQLAQSIVELSDTPVDLSDGQNVFVGISVGISIFPEDGRDATSLITNANAAMRQAKSEGRQTYRFYKQELTEVAHERLFIESRLRRAIENGELEVYYQPMVDVVSGRIVGAEALSRWNDAKLGSIPPDRFIPLAEEAGLIGALGRQVMETACKQAVKWQSKGHKRLKIAVNLSSRQFETEGLVNEVSSIIRDAGLQPANLELEITESMIMEQGSHSFETLNAILELAVEVSMDDFGTGYSSLAYLKRFAIDKVKIDRMFINELPHDRDDVEIVSAIIAMAHNLNLRVVAEGVETPEQLAFLKEQGCDEYQGYLISPPVPADEFDALVRDSGSTTQARRQAIESR